MKYAIIKSGGKQYKVEENSVINIDRVKAEKNSVYEFKDVLFVRDGQEVEIGTPFIAGKTVIGKVIGDIRGEKLSIGKYKAKVHYRRRIGFRADYTSIRIEKITNKSHTEKGKSASKSKSK